MADIVITGQMKKADGTSVPVEITIKETVVAAPPPPAPAPSVALPVISSLVAGNDNIPSGAIVDIKWATTGASKVEITENAGTPIAVDVSGMKYFYPKVTTVFKLRAYNTAGSYVEKSVTVNVQGSTAPAPAPTTAPAPAPTTAPAPAPTTGGTTALVNDIVDASGAIVPAAWDEMAAAIGTDKWADYRFGKAAAVTTGGTKFFERPHIKYPDDASNAGQRNSIYEYGKYEYESSMSSGGFYSTVHMDAATFQAASGSGIVTLQAAGYTNNTGQLKPQIAWQMGSIEHPNLSEYRKAGGVLPTSGDARPVFIATANDAANDNGPSRLAVCANGAIIGIGSNTADNVVSLQLPANKVPVAGAITSKSEALYVLVWDKLTRKTQVAVILLAGMANLGNERWTNYTGDNLISEDWWQEWRQPYPGLPNRGNVAFMKLLGYVDTGLSAGTCIGATTGMHPWQMLQGNGRAIGYDMSPVKSHLADLRDGGRFGGMIARGGLLAVGSKSEKKVALLDLKALHEWIYDSYYGANNTRGQAQNLGMGDSQWPQVMSVSGVKIPLVTTLSLDAPVGDLRFTSTQPSPQSGNGVPQLWIGKTNGVADIYVVGDYVPGTRTGKQGQLSQIVRKGQITGLGPVSTMAQLLGMRVTGGGVDLNTGFWFVCRSTREIGYAKVNSDGSGGTVPLKYIPSADQCLDPVSLGDIDNYSNESNSQVVCDYNGRKLAGFRTDTLRHNGTWSAWPQDTPVQATNGIKVEYNGAFQTSGKPVHVLTANVP